MKKILNVNCIPFLHGYFFSSSFMSIVMNRVRFNQSDVSVSDMIWVYDNYKTSDFICRVSIDGKNIICKDLAEYNISNNSNNYDIFLGKYHEKNIDSCFMYNTCCNIVSFSFKLNAIKEVCRWSMAGIELIEEENSDSSNILRIMFAPLNIIRIMGRLNGVEIFTEISNSQNYQYIKCTFYNKIIALGSVDGLLWDELYVIDNYNFSSNAKVGFFSWIGDDYFEEWFYSNFIQIHCSKDLEPYYDVKLNYYLTPTKDYDYNVMNPWLEQFFISKDYVDKNNGIFDLIKFYLNQNKYIALHLNEVHLPQMWAYKLTNFEHESLIYGIDTETKIVYLMGFDKGQNFIPYSLSFDLFYTAYETAVNNCKISIINFQIPTEKYTFSVERVCMFFNEYLKGVNSSYRETLVKDPVERCYGLSVYDVLINNPNKLKDKKITYILYEHKVIMMYRIRFFYKKGVMDYSLSEKLEIQAHEMVDVARNILLLSMKYALKENISTLNSIRELLTILKSKDIIFINEIIQNIEMK